MSFNTSSRYPESEEPQPTARRHADVRANEREAAQEDIQVGSSGWVEMAQLDTEKRLAGVPSAVLDLGFSSDERTPYDHMRYYRPADLVKHKVTAYTTKELQDLIRTKEIPARNLAGRFVFNTADVRDLLLYEQSHPAPRTLEDKQQRERDQAKARMRQWRRNHPDQHRERNREWQQSPAGKQQRAAYMREYRLRQKLQQSPATS